MLESITPLFPSPLLQFKHEDADRLNQLLLSEAEAIRQGSAGVNKSNQRGWHSEPDLFRREDPGIKELCRFIVQAVQTAEQKTSSQKEIPSQMQVMGWININGTGAFNTPHAHEGFRWSGCYYVNQPKVAEGRSGYIEFLDPRSGIQAWPVKGASFGNTKVALRPSAGSLLLFPSYLVHWVYPNEEEDERVSIAFNARYTT